MNSNYDIVIVGGGMVGAALACALGDSPLSVALIEREIPKSYQPDDPLDLRVSALSLASQRLLEHVGAWPHIANMRLCPYRRMRVWEDQGATEFNSQDIAEPILGHIVENRLTQLGLWARLPDFANIEVIAPTEISQLEYRPGESRVTLTDGRTLTATLLVGADGGASKVRTAAGIGVTAWDYGQHALVINVETELPQQDITWQKFLPTGPLAFLPLPGAHGSLVWYQSPETVKHLKDLADEDLRQAILQAFPACLGGLGKVLARGSFPLCRQHAQHYVRPGLALVGDAAHRINPLAGQGVNIGFLDAAALAEVLLAARPSQLASLSTLSRYERMRRFENLKMMTAMDVFYHAFSNDLPPLKLLRNLGLGLADKLTPVKHKVMAEAMGLTGAIPRLARG